jgi:hypothetical protein
MKKTVLWSSAAGLLAAIVATLIFSMLRPQVITLKDGTKLTLVAVSYGKHHVFKGIKTTSSGLHGRLAVDTTNQTLVVWIKSERKSGQWQNGQWPNFQLMVYDTANTACVASWQSTGTQIKRGVYVQGYTLNAFPRRDKKMILRVAAWGNMGGMRVAKGQFDISNPGPRHFPQWVPEPMPDTQSDGDLDVTLTRCVAGARGFMFGARAQSKDPLQKCVRVAFHVEQHGNTATNWQPVSIETSDATGNHLAMNGWSSSRDENGDPILNYQWGLWPEEPAWKLRVEMSRTARFANSELWAITNVPVGRGRWQDLWNFQMQNRPGNFPGAHNQTGSPFAETTLNGTHLKIFPAIRITDQNFGAGQMQGGFHVTADPELPEGYRLSLAVATDDRGHKLSSWGPNGGNGNYIFQLPDIRDAKFLNLTIALHKSRFVEFTIKPAKE